MIKPKLQELYDDGYDVASPEELEEQLTIMRNASANVWECIKKGRTDTLVAAAGAHLDSIDYCIERIEHLMLK